MKKKILALFLVMVMCVTTLPATVLAADIEKVSSTIPGTDIAYNRVENITVKIPGTEITYTLQGVSDQVGLVYEDGIPNYIFAFYESGVLTINNAGEYGDGREGPIYKDGELLGFWGMGDFYQIDEGKQFKRGLNDDPGDSDAFVRILCTDIYEDNTCAVTCDKEESKKVARVSIRDGHGGGKDKAWYPYDLMSCVYDENQSCYIPAEIEKFDISKIAVTDDENNAENSQYSIIKGANSVWASNSNEDLTITSDGDFSKFTGVKMDNEMLESKNYEVKSGSTVVTLKASYLKTLDSGKHTVTFVYTNGEVSTQIEIKGKKAPSNQQNVGIPNTDGKIGVTGAGCALILTTIILTIVLRFAVIRRNKHLLK